MKSYTGKFEVGDLVRLKGLTDDVLFGKIMKIKSNRIACYGVRINKSDLKWFP